MQLLFLGAASRIAQTGNSVGCPACAAGPLRFYHHVLSKERGTGTLWVWCPTCGRTTHLPRIRWRHEVRDPLAAMSEDAFIQLEKDMSELWLDRLDRLWEAGDIAR